MTTSFESKKIIVAGGTSGIGLAAAQLFAEKKASVTVTGRNPEKLAAAAKEGLQTAQVDSTGRAALDQFFQAYGKIDHLVIALSGHKGAVNFTDLSMEELLDGFKEKLVPQLDTLQAALPYMNVGGSITFITGIAASANMPGTSGLGAINGAVEIMVPILAKELKPLRINAVSPGVVDTPWWDFVPAESRQAVFAQYGSQTLVGRVAQPADIADAIVFVAGNEYMTGKVIKCDGGLG